MTAALKPVSLGLAGLLALGLAGCGGPEYAPVSGVVTLDGRPCKGVIVNFQPLATPADPDPGRGSYGHTDEQGRFDLVVDDRTRGAVVGKHRVRIVTPWDNARGGFDPELGSPDGDPAARAKVETDPIPPEWNAASTKSFDVPPGGTDRADFAIRSRRQAK